MTEGSWAALYQQRPYLIGGNVIPIDKLRITPVWDYKTAPIKRSVR